MTPRPNQVSGLDRVAPYPVDAADPWVAAALSLKRSWQAVEAWWKSVTPPTDTRDPDVEEVHRAVNEMRCRVPRTAEEICSDEQIAIWADEMLADIGQRNLLRDDLDYDDTIDLHHTIGSKIKDIVVSALEDSR